MKNILSKITWRRFFDTVVMSFLLLVLVSVLYVIIEPEDYSSDCNVAKILVRGEVVGYKNGGSEDWTDETVAGDIYDLIEMADNDSDIEAIIIEISSRGGSAVAGTEIAEALKRASKPTIALVKEQAASTAYEIATGADKIFASEFSSVGAIGITQSFFDDVEKSKKEGYNYNQLQTGKYKDMFSGDRPLTYEERQMVMKDLEYAHDILVKDIAKNRGIEASVVAKFADGSIIPPHKAIEVGLIDKIGGLYEVKEYLAEILGVSLSEIDVCDYEY